MLRKNKCVDVHKIKIKCIFVMQRLIVTDFVQLWQSLNCANSWNLMQQSFIRYYHLRINVEDLTKFFGFTMHEISRNDDFLWSVFFPLWTESYPILSIHRKIRIRENLHFKILYPMSNLLTQEFCSQYCYTP